MQRSARFILIAAAVLGTACIDRDPVATGDVAFNTAACALGMDDAGALSAITDLTAMVAALQQSGSLNGGQANALSRHLVNIARSITAARYCPALDQLHGFMQQLRNFVEDGVLTDAEADPLLELALQIIEGVTEPPPVNGIPFVTIATGSVPAAFHAVRATFGGAIPANAAGPVVLVNDNTALPTEGCAPLVGFPVGAIALVDRGSCPFVQKAANAQAAGAIAIVVINNVAGLAIAMGGSDPSIVIPAVMVSQNIGAGLKIGLPANGAVGTELPDLAAGTPFVAVPTPSPAAGLFQASAAVFGGEITETGIAGVIALVNDGSASPTFGCNALVEFPAGAIALIDRGDCAFVVKAANAQAAGAIGMILVNNVGGAPTAMGGTAPDVTIPAAMIAQAAGTALKGGAPTNGTLRRAQ